MNATTTSTLVSWPQKDGGFVPQMQLLPFPEAACSMGAWLFLCSKLILSFEQVASGEELGDKAEIRQHLLLPQGTVHWVGEIEGTAKGGLEQMLLLW